MTEYTKADLILFFIEDILRLSISDETALHLIRAFMKIMMMEKKQ